LTANYPALGREKCAAQLNRTEAAIRYKASHLKLRFDPSPEFTKEWQSRAAQSKVGKKRPEQAGVMKRLHAAGKLKRSPEQLSIDGKRHSEWLANNHPRGMLGKTHSKETLDRISETSTERWNSMTADEQRAVVVKAAKTRVSRGVKLNPHGKWKADWRTIGGQRAYFRSRWEANYARYLEWLKSIGNIAKWEHEPETFWFDKVRRGCVSYLPDFRVTNPDGSTEYHEVKGWMDARSKTKIKRMAKYHPKTKLVVIDAKAYRKLAKQISASIDGWE
jgi:hypothetical protein